MRVQLGGQFDRFFPISRFAHDLHVIFPLQQFTSALTDEYVVIGEKDADVLHVPVLLCQSVTTAGKKVAKA
jgi:hypothetical protein